MPPNLSMSTGFGLFRKGNLLTAHEHVANSYVDAYMYIHLLCLCWRQLPGIYFKLGNELCKSEASGSYRVTKRRRNRYIHGR